MSVNRNKSDDLKGVQMIEKEEEKDKYRVYAEVSPLRHLRPQEEKPGGSTCRKRTYRFFSIIISYTHANTHTHSKADLQVV